MEHVKILTLQLYNKLQLELVQILTQYLRLFLHLSQAICLRRGSSCPYFELDYQCSLQGLEQDSFMQGTKAPSSTYTH